MTDLSSVARQPYFSENLLAWTALRHFLPTRLVHELASAMVQRLSGGEITLDRLFSGSMTSGPEWLASWSLKPLDTQTPLEQFLQFNIRSMAWNNDGDTHVPDKIGFTPDRLSPQAIEFAVQLARVDLKFPLQHFNGLRVPEEPSYQLLIDTLAASREMLESSTPRAFLDAISSLLKSLEGPLSPVIMKHIGDLCADSDEWRKASVIYDAVASALNEERDETWRELFSPLRGSVVLSRLSAIKMIDGAAAAAAFAKKSLETCLPEDRAFLLANGSFDIYVAEAQANGVFSVPDLRAAILSPPLLHSSHERSFALQERRKSDYRNSHRGFWAVLRRQTALGLLTESRVTKAFYAESIFASLKDELRRNHQPDSFRLGLALMIESEDSAVASKFEWTDELVGAYVDQASIEYAIARSQAHPGVDSARQLVLVELFHAWITVTTLDKNDLSLVMLKHVVALAAKSPVSFFSGENLGGRSLEILKDFAEERPELRSLIAGEVAQAVAGRLTKDSFWKAQDTALELAREYTDVFSREQLITVLRPALEILSSADPAAAGPLVDTALSILVTPAVKKLSAEDPSLGRLVVDTIFRFTVHRRDNPSRVLFLLYEFDATLFRETAIAEHLATAVAEVREHALQSNSTAAVGNIQALLVSPAISGIKGIKDALRGLASIITPVNGRYTSLSLANAYAPFMLLANIQEDLAEQLPVGIEELRSWLVPMIDPIVELWRRAIDRPAVFSPFSLPAATVPNPTIVHNWAFASLMFAGSLDRSGEVNAALSAAMAQPALRDPIVLAHATRSTAKDGNVSIDPEGIRMESREGFYSALGRRLFVLQRMAGNEFERQLCGALLYQCLRQGPRALDAAVILAAGRLSLQVSGVEKSDYVKRMGSDRGLRLALIPLLDLIETSD